MFPSQHSSTEYVAGFSSAFNDIYKLLWPLKKPILNRGIYSLTTLKFTFLMTIWIRNKVIASFKTIEKCLQQLMYSNISNSWNSEQPCCISYIFAAERPQGASSNIIRIQRKYIRGDEFSNSSLFITMHCT